MGSWSVWSSSPPPGGLDPAPRHSWALSFDSQLHGKAKVIFGLEEAMLTVSFLGIPPDSWKGGEGTVVWKVSEGETELFSAGERTEMRSQSTWALLEAAPPVCSRRHHASVFPIYNSICKLGIMACPCCNTRMRQAMCKELGML